MFVNNANNTFDVLLRKNINGLKKCIDLHDVDENVIRVPRITLYYYARCHWFYCVMLKHNIFVLQNDCCTDDLAVEACVPDVGLWTGIYRD